MHGGSALAADFSAFGEFAAAGARATKLALDRAADSASSSRIPIAAAIVHRATDGTLTALATGANGRIPTQDGGAGYPTDHGETACLRALGDTSAVDWASVVFATSLSPCVMCSRTLTHLHRLGLRRVVIAEAQSFGGRSDLLRVLPGMVLVELTQPDAVARMRAFARKYPWDWAADIGEIPPCEACAPAAPTERLLQQLEARGAHAAVVGPGGDIVASAADERVARGGNPVHAAPMLCAH
jgi:tRNA(Arg) A34 adenosine deaminase TadA